MQLEAWAAFALFSIAASASDLKSREIPDWLNAGMLLVGLAICWLAGGMAMAFTAVIATAVWFAFAYSVYAVGAWAGGDVKLFAAMAPFAVAFGGGALDFLPVFLASVLLLLPAACLIYWQGLWKLRGQAWNMAKAGVLPAISGAVASYAAFSAIGLAAGWGNWLALVFVAVIFVFFRMPLIASATVLVAATALTGFNAVAFATLFAVSFALAFLPNFFTLISREVLRYDEKVGRLKEGDVPAQTVLVRKGKVVLLDPTDWRKTLAAALAEMQAGKGVVSAISAARSGASGGGRVVADALSANGLSRAQIKELKRLKLKRLRLKRTLPFAPAIAAGVAVFFGVLPWLAGK